MAKVSGEQAVFPGRSKAPRRVRVFEIEQGPLAVGLFCAFAFAFLLAPYWATPEGFAWGMVLAFALTAIGAVWVQAAAATVRVRALGLPPLGLVGLAAMCLAVQWRALTFDLPWRGDEASHVGAVLAILRQPLWLIAAVAGAAAVGFARRPPRSIRWLLCGSFAVLCVAIGSAYRYELESRWLRYPGATRWLQAFFAIPSLGPGGLRYQEAFFRSVPFLCIVLIAWVVFARVKPAAGVRSLVALAVVTAPLLLYYGSILYLELPAVLLMLVVCLDIRRLISYRAELVRRLPSWLALIGLGFVKETVAGFLAAFILCRLWVQLRSHRHLPKIRAEASIAFAITAPLILYLSISRLAGVGRNYDLHLNHLVDLRLYGVLARSWIEQGGLLLLLAVIGGVSLVRRRRFVEAAFLTVSTALSAALHFLDAEYWIGYSRFNLFLIPAAIAAALTALRTFARRGRGLALVAAVWLASNAWLSPLYLDGSKQPNWGSPLIDTAEHYYPYRSTIEWLRDHYPQSRIVFTGLTYPYYLGFYFERYRWRPQVEMRLAPEEPARRLEVLRDVARSVSAGTVVVYHPLPGEPAFSASTLAPLRLERVVRNQAHRLMVFTAGWEVEAALDR